MEESSSTGYSHTIQRVILASVLISSLALLSSCSRNRPNILLTELRNDGVIPTTCAYECLYSSKKTRENDYLFSTRIPFDDPKDHPILRRWISLSSLTEEVREDEIASVRGIFRKSGADVSKVKCGDGSNDVLMHAVPAKGMLLYWTGSGDFSFLVVRNL